MKNSPLYIVWSHDSDTGFSIIDEQHRGIVATLNSLHYFIQQGHGLEALKPTLQIMKGYMGFHLKTEEMILEAADYPMLEERKEFQKQTFIDFSAISREATMHREPELLLKFLKDWWFTHDDKHRKKYGNYLKG